MYLCILFIYIDVSCGVENEFIFLLELETQNKPSEIPEFYPAERQTFLAESRPFESFVFSAQTSEATDANLRLPPV